MNSISVKNYRSIIESPNIELKPITVLVGKNSAGKSSFIRLFPLLKQTVEKKISDPLLWYGDYVDLGDFNQAVSRINPKGDITISFSLNSNDKIGYFGINYIKMEEVSVNVTICEKKIRKYDISFFDQKIEVIDDMETKIIINGDEFAIDNTKFIASRDDKSLLPTILVEKDNKRSRPFFYMDENLLKRIHGYVIGDSNYLIEKGDYYRDYHKIDRINLLNSRQGILDSFTKLNRTKFENKKINHKTFMKYNNLLIANGINRIVEGVNESISYDLQMTKYIKPIRARVDRYYRVQGLRIDELDADGGNLPIILHNLSTEERRRFEAWSKEAFGVVFSAKSSEGHISMIVKDDINGDFEANLADTGYGYSQMLPIVMLLWMIHNTGEKERMMNDRYNVVIEQPELHLHPAFQAKMMDIFVKIVQEAKKFNIDIKIMFETHSETMINRLGELIESKQIDKDDVNILFFEKEKEKTKIIKKDFNSNGLIVGWPTDFFSSEV